MRKRWVWEGQRMESEGDSPTETTAVSHPEKPKLRLIHTSIIKLSIFAGPFTFLRIKLNIIYWKFIVSLSRFHGAVQVLSIYNMYFLCINLINMYIKYKHCYFLGKKQIFLKWTNRKKLIHPNILTNSSIIISLRDLTVTMTSFYFLILAIHYDFFRVVVTCCPSDHLLIPIKRFYLAKYLDMGLDALDSALTVKCPFGFDPVRAAPHMNQLKRINNSTTSPVQCRIRTNCQACERFCWVVVWIFFPIKRLPDVKIQVCDPMK